MLRSPIPVAKLLALQVAHCAQTQPVSLREISLIPQSPPPSPSPPLYGGCRLGRGGSGRCRQAGSNAGSNASDPCLAPQARRMVRQTLRLKTFRVFPPVHIVPLNRPKRTKPVYITAIPPLLHGLEAQRWDRFRLAATIRIGESDARSAGALLTRWRIQNDVQAGPGDDLAGFDSLFFLRNRLRGGQSSMECPTHPQPLREQNRCVLHATVAGNIRLNSAEG
jgi:hypothetical protein